MASITANGISIAYELHKQPPPQLSKGWIVLINGLAAAKETWYAQVRSFTQSGYNVLSFDNRGVGASSETPGPYTAEMLAADAKALVDSLGLNHAKFHLLGVSMGGVIAQQYALNYPGDLLSVTLACTFAAPGPFCSRMFSIWAELAPDKGVPFVMRDLILWAFTHDFFNNRPAELTEVERSMDVLEMSSEAYLAQLAIVQNFNSTQRLAEIKDIPILVLAAEEDKLIPFSLSRKLHEMLPGSQWVTVQGGHASLWEFPHDFNIAFLKFLASI